MTDKDFSTAIKELEHYLEGDDFIRKDFQIVKEYAVLGFRLKEIIKPGASSDQILHDLFRELRDWETITQF